MARAPPTAFEGTCAYRRRRDEGSHEAHDGSASVGRWGDAQLAVLVAQASERAVELAPRHVAHTDLVPQAYDSVDGDDTAPLPEAIDETFANFRVAGHASS